MLEEVLSSPHIWGQMKQKFSEQSVLKSCLFWTGWTPASQREVVKCGSEVRLQGRAVCVYSACNLRSMNVVVSITSIIGPNNPNHRTSKFFLGLRPWAPPKVTRFMVLLPFRSVLGCAGLWPHHHHSGGPVENHTQGLHVLCWTAGRDVLRNHRRGADPCCPWSSAVVLGHGERREHLTHPVSVHPSNTD